MSRRWITGMWGVCVAATVVLYGANLFLGDLNQDEGWYLYATRLVSQGEMPYADFAYTQGPVLPFAYVPAMPLVSRWGVAGGRLYTALLGLAGVGLACWLAGRLVPAAARRRAALLALCLIGVNVYQAYFCTVVKTYALTALLLTGAFLVLSYASRRRGYAASFLSGVLFMLAAGTRSSAAFALPAVFLVLLVQSRREGAGRSGACPWLLAGGAVLTALVLFVPFLVKAPRGLWFALVEYHAGRDAGGLVPMVAYKVGFFSRLVHAYTAAALIFLALVAYRKVSRPRVRVADAPDPSRSPLLPALWWSVLLISAVHVMAPFPYDDYQVIVYPLFGVALSVELALLGECGAVTDRRGTARAAWLVPAVALATLASALASPINQSWFVGERDRIWWPLKKESPLTRLRRVARFVRGKVGGDDLLLTQDTYLAVEAGLRVPAGMELGPFCYFRDWDREKALACNVLNRELFLELLAKCPARIAAFSGYGLSIRSPGVRPLDEQGRELWDAVLAGYAPLEDDEMDGEKVEGGEIPNFGQAGTTLRVLRRKERTGP